MATLVCGAARLHSRSASPLLRSLPTVVHLPSTSPHAGEVAATMRLLARAGETAGPGTEVLLARLGDLLLVQILRAWLAEQQPGHGGWLGALRDPHIGRAIADVHTDPGARWSVARMAARAGLSRSHFAQRFPALVGEPPSPTCSDGG